LRDFLYSQSILEVEINYENVLTTLLIEA